MNKLRCWPGCLAVVRCRNQKHDNGKVVEVLRRPVPGRDRFVPSGVLLTDLSTADSWWVRGTDLHFRARTWADECQIVGGQSEVAYGDDVLIPLTPPPGSVSDEELREAGSPNTTKETA